MVLDVWSIGRCAEPVETNCDEEGKREREKERRNDKPRPNE
jgi:hypothetical protein